jgi:hypothetical protein
MSDMRRALKLLEVIPDRGWCNLSNYPSDVTKLDVLVLHAAGYIKVNVSGPHACLEVRLTGKGRTFKGTLN